MFARLKAVNLDRLAAAILTIALVGSLTYAAIRSDGFERSSVNLHDAGIWMIRSDEGQVGRVNTEIEAIDVSFPMATPSDDIVQTDSSVLLVDSKSGQVFDVDVAASVTTSTVTFKGGASLELGMVAKPAEPSTDVDLAEPVAAVVRAGGDVWVREASAVTSIHPDEEPTYKAGKGSVVAVDGFGTAHLYDTSSDELVELNPTGVVGKTKVGEFADPAVTAVGERVVVLDQRLGKVRLPDGKLVALSDHGTRWALQHSGPAADHVVVGTDKELLAIDLKTGSIESLVDGQRGIPSRPVRLNGCDYGAWAGGSPSSARYCDASSPEITDSQSMQAFVGAPVLVFRVNRDRILLNSVSSGANLLFTPDEPVVVDDWTQAETDDPDNREQPIKTQSEPDECKVPVRAPKISPTTIEVGGRPERPILVPVLDRVKLNADPCDVLNLSLPLEVSTEQASVAVVDSGAALQITPASGTGGTSVHVPFELNGRSSSSVRGTVVVDVSVDSENHPPKAEPDTTNVILGTQRTEARFDVLLNDPDPEGDPLTLISAQPGSGTTGVTVRYQPDGMVVVSPGSTIGTKVINYQVVDDRGAGPVTGSLTVEVLATGKNNPPKARPDRVTAVTSRPVSVDLVANDSDVDGDSLTVVAIDKTLPTGVTVEKPGSDSGMIRVKVDDSATSPSFFNYQLSDGSGDPPVQGTVRIDVVDESVNSAPVAVRDDVVARDGVPALVDLVDNDVDADGDVLAVTALTPDKGAEDVTVEIFDMSVVRVTVPVGFTQSASFTYTISDGRISANGKLLVRPLSGAETNLPPLITDDEISVRAGEVTSVPVLANDVDPEGEDLSLVPELREDQQPTDDGTVRAFVLHDQVHIVTTAAAAGTYRVGYSASDPVPYTEDGLITVTVVGRDSGNRAPDDPQLHGRVRVGKTLRLDVPLVGLDPDGDVVAITGLAKPPSLGTATIEGGVLVYEPSAKSVGGTDRFKVKLDDSRGGQTQGNVSIAVVPVEAENTPPLAVVDKVEVARGGRQTIAVLTNDTDSDSDEIELQTRGVDAPSSPRMGTIKVHGEEIVYTQDGSISGGDLEAGVFDTFDYGVSDGRGGTSRGSVIVLIKKEVKNKAPMARDDFVAPQAPGGVVEIQPLQNDYDPDGSTGDLTLEVPDLNRVESETGAKIRVSGSTVRVTVAAGTPRSVSLPYKVSDASGATAQAIILIPVVANLPPVAMPDTASVAAGEAVEINVVNNDWDPEKGGEKSVGLELIDVAQVDGGEVRPRSDGTVVFTANPDASGFAGFEYLIKDEAGLQTWGRVNLEIKGQNFAPTFTAASATVSAGGETVVDLSLMADDQNPSDVPELEFKLLGGATARLTAELSGNRGERLTIAASEDALGDAVKLNIEVSDGNDTGTGVVSVEVTPFDGAKPVANPDESRTRQGKAVKLDVVMNDLKGAAKEIEVVSATVQSPDAGVVSRNGNVLEFTPASGYFGRVTVAYTIGDSTGETERESQSMWRIDVIGRPDAPAAPTGVADNTTVTLRWMSPNPNGANITGYLIEAMPGGIVQQSEGTIHTFTGLKNNVAYTFRVLALNEAVTDQSEQTNWSAYSVPFTPDIVPETPQPPTLKFGDHQINVAWVIPRSQGSPVNGLELQVDGVVGSGPTVQALPASAPAFTWAGLTNGNTYRFRLRAQNNRGWSEWGNWSDPSDINAVPAGKPLPPTFVQAQPGDERFSVGGTAVVSWQWARSSHGNGAEVESFSIVGTSGTGHQVNFSGPDVRSPFRASGLRNGESYTFAVTATTKAGSSEVGRSPVIRPSKPPTDIPASPLSGTDGDASTVLTYSAPPPDSYGPGNGGDPDGFRYEIRRISGAGGAGPWTVGTTSPTLTGLQNGGTYSFGVKACNTNGCSIERTINNVRPYTNPGSVRSLSGSLSGGTATWTWSAPSSDGGRPIAHYVLSDDGSGSTTNTRYSRSIAEGETLTLCVRAVNQGADGGRSTGPQQCDSVNRPRPVAWAEVTDGTASDSQAGTCAGLCRKLKLTLSSNAPRGSYVIKMNVAGVNTHTFTAAPNGVYESFGCPTCVILYGYNTGIDVTLTIPGHGTVTFIGRSDANSNYTIRKEFTL